MASLEHIVADDLADHAPRYASAVLERVADDLPDLLADAERAALARAGSEALLREFATGLRLGVSDGFHAPSAATAFAGHLAREGVPLAHVLRSYRLGQEVLVARASELVTHADEPDAPAAVARLVALSFRFADAAMTDIAAVYEREREAVLRADVARRADIVARILTNADVDAHAAERTLAYRLDGWHLALVCWPPRPAGHDAPLDMLAEIARSLTDARPLVIAEAGATAAAWVARGGRLDDHEVSRIATRLEPHGLSLAAGEPQRGLAGFARTRAQAEQARTVARLRPRPVFRYRDVSLLALLLHDPDAATAFAEEELGGLAAPTRGAGELRATLAAYFAAGHDRSRTARALGVHRNTVARRLDRAQTAIGHPLDERVRELETALAIGEEP